MANEETPGGTHNEGWGERRGRPGKKLDLAAGWCGGEDGEEA